MVSETVEITVIKLKVRLLQVSFGTKENPAHHLVAGGRLVSTLQDGKITSFPDLPKYDYDRFPVPVLDWIDGGHPEIAVSVVTPFGLKSVRPVRAHTLLFTARDPRVVTEWLRSQRK